MNNELFNENKLQSHNTPVTRRNDLNPFNIKTTKVNHNNRNDKNKIVKKTAAAANNHCCNCELLKQSLFSYQQHSTPISILYIKL